MYIYIHIYIYIQLFISIIALTPAKNKENKERDIKGLRAANMKINKTVLDKSLYNKNV